MPGVIDMLRMQPFTASLNSHRIFLYTLVSSIAVSAAIVNALKNHSNFYSVAIYLSKSNRSVLVLANFGLLLALLCGRVVQRIFFGPLRPAEVERLYDRLWFFVTESLLAFTIFRDDFDIPFALMFGFLLFVKSFHWLASDRIEWMDQRPYPGPPKLFHVRMNSLFFILWTVDFVMFAFAVESTVTNGVSGMVLFASEYAILMASALNTSAKYFLSLYELRRASQRGGENAPPWENKSMWVFYIELSTDFLKLTTYLVFFTLIITFYGLPLNIVRDVYITARSFVTRLRALQRYQTATRNMDQRYPDATEEEMTTMSDRTCIICREEMVFHGRPTATTQGSAPGTQPQTPAGARDGPNTTPKKLPCGHIFHFYCLRSWLERQQSCPTCRRTVLDPVSQGEGGQPGVPQLGGAPQPPNAFGVPGLQGAQPAARQNNGMGGLAGRLLGALPAGAPGNVAQAPGGAAIPPQFPGNLGFGQPGGPNNVLIQYNIQYQIARPQPQGAAQQPQPQPQLAPQPLPQPPQQLEPPPLYNGFQGPGGAWQPWEIDPRLFGPPPQNQPRSPTSTPTPTTSAPASTQTQPETSTRPAPAEGLSDSVLHDEGTSTPREAAALAALERSNKARPNSTSTGSTRPSLTPISDTTTTTIPDSSEASSTCTSASSESSSSSWEQSLESGANTTSNGTGPSADTHLKIPTMIPVYDFHRLPETVPAGSSVRSPRVSPRPNGQASPYFRSAPRPRGQALQHNPPTPTRAHMTHAQLNGQRQPIRYQQPNTSRPPISQLPPTLTEAQLALMDRVTREAIDERLRVLEGVSGAVFRFIEDLMRVRSSLPAPMNTPGIITSPANSSASASSSSDAAGGYQPSIASASETLDEAIAGAREAAESSSKMKESLKADLGQPAATEPSSYQQEQNTSSTPQSEVESA